MKKFIIFSVLIGAMSILIAPKAGAVIIDSVTVKPTGAANAKCSGNLPVAMDASISGATKPNKNGDGTFKVNLSWKSCKGKADTRAYAVTGNKEICPKTGSYGLSGSAYDCVKYIGSPPYSGASSLSCGSKRNGDCIEPGFKKRGVLKEANKPDADNSKSIAMSYHIGDWKSKQLRDGSETVASGKLCQYYKTGSPYFGTNNTQKGCISVSIKVTWTAEWTLEPTPQYRVGASGKWKTGTGTVKVGDKVYWRPTVKNTEKGTSKGFKTLRTVSATAIDTAQNDWKSSKYTPTSRSALKGGSTGVYSETQQRLITVNDVGKTICVEWGVNPWNESDNNPGYHYGATKACVVVSASAYELTPEVSPASSLLDAGSAVSIAASVENTSNVSNNTPWELRKITVAAATALPANLKATAPADTTTDACAWFGGGRCDLIDNNQRIFTQSSTTVSTQPDQIFNDPIGTKICWILSLKPPTPDPAKNNVWRHSTPSCFTVAKKPKVHVLGSDIRVRGKIRTSTSILDVKTLYGSWSEFAAMSTEENIAAASGAALRQGSGDNSFTQSSWSGLTFANTKPAAASDHEFGNLDSLPLPSDVEGHFKRQPAPTVSDSSLVLPGNAGKTILKAPNNIQVSGTVKGTVVIVADRDVRISGDIRYDASNVKNISDLPQVIIIANTISIDQGVGQVDAWLVARSSINTCADVVRDVANPGLTVNLCNKPLTINGPVATNQLYLFRTAGSEIDTPAAAAEVINLRPDAYLWAYSYGSATSRPNTVSITEQPPRF